MDLHFVMFNVDPDNDTPAVLSKYASDKNLDAKRFNLLTGDLEVIKKTSVQGFKVALKENRTKKRNTWGCCTAHT